MHELLADGDAFDRMLGNYDPPQGNPRFIRALAGLLQRTFGWDIGPQNLAITSGGQSAFFYLFNLLAGRFENGRRRKILLPLAPEYIGYADQGLEADLFVACRPQIDMAAGRRERASSNTASTSPPWKRRSRAKTSRASPSRARPTRRGNVLTDDEVSRLSALAAQHGIPLILDNAYGAPFPNVIFCRRRSRTGRRT